MPMNPDGTYSPATKTVTENVPEWLSDEIDWSFDFQANDWDHGGSTNPASVTRSVEYLRRIEHALADNAPVWTSNYGGWPRIWQKVSRVGMAAKWPYWVPRPTVAVHSSSGGEWFDWNMLTGAQVGGDPNV